VFLVTFYGLSVNFPLAMISHVFSGLKKQKTRLWNSNSSKKEKVCNALSFEI
jgi:hypothetical protein